MLEKTILFLIFIPFLYINIKIIIFDLKYKKIPNKYLWYLLLLIPIYYIYIFLNFPEINYLLFLGQIVLTFIISFILYYFWIWAAWDAKYLLVLSLFIPYIWIIPFIWNIALVTLTYLFWYFLYFYLYKVLFNKNYRQSLWWNIKIDLNERWKVYKQNKWWNTFKIIFKWLITFLLVFVSIRLVRLYLLHWIITTWQNSKFEIINEIIEKYNIYLIFLFIWIFIWWLYFTKLLIIKFKIHISEKFKLDLKLIWNILLGLLSIFLISFISYEYSKNPYEIKKYLFKIFTLYLILYLIFKILKAAYKITFWIAEYKYININNLKEGDIIDKKFLIDSFKNDAFIKQKWIKINKFEKNIDIYNLKKLRDIYKWFNKYHQEKKTKNFVNFNTIKVLKTFSFWIFLIFGFIITIFLKNLIFIFIIKKIKYIIF